MRKQVLCLFLYVIQLVCKQCLVSVGIAKPLPITLCLASVAAPPSMSHRLGTVVVWDFFFFPSEVIHQFSSPVLKVLSDRVVLKPFWLWVPWSKMAGVMKKSQRQINECVSGASSSFPSHFSCQEQWMGTCRLSTFPLPVRCCWELMEENCVETVNTELEKSGNVVIVQGEVWEIKWYLFRSLPYCSLHCSLGIFLLSTRKSASTSWKTQMKLLP